MGVYGLFTTLGDDLSKILNYKPIEMLVNLEKIFK